MDYREIIKMEREDHDESQRALAEKLGTSQVMVWKYETRQNEMPIRHLIAICHHYKVSADYLLNIPYTYRRPKPRAKID